MICKHKQTFVGPSWLKMTATLKDEWTKYWPVFLYCHVVVGWPAT